MSLFLQPISERTQLLAIHVFLISCQSENARCTAESIHFLSVEAGTEQKATSRKLCNLWHLHSVAALHYCQAAVSDTPGSSRSRQEETVAFEGSEVHDWISLLKHNSQTAMSWKELGVGKGEEYKDQHEKDWKETLRDFLREWQWAEERENLSISLTALQEWRLRSFLLHLLFL